LIPELCPDISNQHFPGTKKAKKVPDEKTAAPLKGGSSRLGFLLSVSFFSSKFALLHTPAPFSFSFFLSF
jgi:hypothetical protein